MCPPDSPDPPRGYWGIRGKIADKSPAPPLHTMCRGSRGTDMRGIWGEGSIIYARYRQEFET